jgi:predicted  nucleic acid-binding Zn-ribbon protein
MKRAPEPDIADATNRKATAEMNLTSVGSDINRQTSIVQNARSKINLNTAELHKLPFTSANEDKIRMLQEQIDEAITSIEKAQTELSDLRRRKDQYEADLTKATGDLIKLSGGKEEPN